MNEDLMEEFSSVTPTIEQEYTEEDLHNDLACDDMRNVVINKFRNFTEVVVYNRAFSVNISGTSNKKIDRTRKFKYDENEELQIAKADVDFNDLLAGNYRSRRRALDMFFGYALSNEWRYFITITFDPKKVDRTKRSEVNHAWELFRKKLQYRFPKIKILLINEEHRTDGCLHFHGLIGQADLKPYLTMAINNMKYLNYYDYNLRQKVYKYDLEGNLIPNKYYGHLLKTEFGDQIYNFSKEIFDFGFTTCIELHKEDVPGDNDRIVMYLQKYMLKNYNSVAYNKRTYYRTLNVVAKEKIITKSIDTSSGQVLNELLASNKVMKKQTDKMTVYLIPNDETDYRANNIYDTSIEVTEEIKPKEEKLYTAISAGTQEYLDVLDIFE